jgi:protein ImuB
MLWACLHFPLLPLEALARSDPGQSPLAIAEGATRPRILVLNAPAHAAGIRAGMDVSAALALAPQLAVQARNRPLEAQALQEIAQWAMQFAPAPSLEGEDSVLLEIGGGLKLFGGPARLLAAVHAGLPALGFSAQVAAAPTPTAALMLARAQQARTILDSKQLAGELAALPVAVLGCSQQHADTLAEIGVRTVGALLALPRDGLARRFGPGLLDTLDRALGRAPDPRLPFAAPERFCARLELPAPAWEVEALLFGSKRLLAGLGGWLRGRGWGAMRISLELIHEEGPPSRVELALSSPSRDPAHLGLLLRERLERTQLRARVEAIALATGQCEPLANRDSSLFPGTEAGEDTRLIERLCARLGDDAVCALQPCADHRPELAWRARRPAGSSPALLPPGPRPLWLLAEPRPLAAFVRDTHTPVVLMDGPERIESGWWEDRDVCRDYFLARARSGQTLWVFRERSSGAEADCAWQVHGIFA